MILSLSFIPRHHSQTATVDVRSFSVFSVRREPAEFQETWRSPKIQGASPVTRRVWTKLSFLDDMISIESQHFHVAFHIIFWCAHCTLNKNKNSTVAGALTLDVHHPHKNCPTFWPESLGRSFPKFLGRLGSHPQPATCGRKNNTCWYMLIH